MQTYIHAYIHTYSNTNMATAQHTYIRRLRYTEADIQATD